MVSPRRIRVRRGDTIVLTGGTDPVEPPPVGEEIRLGCALPEVVDALGVGDRVLFDDGEIAADVCEVSAAVGPDGAEEPWARLEVVRCREGGRWLGSEKGINVPGLVVDTPALTDEDRAHLRFAARHADVVAVSFVRTPRDVADAVEAVRAAGDETSRELGLLLKIETRQAYRALPALLLEGMRHPRVGVMIARGDLAVEMGFESLSEIPRNITLLCQAARVPVVLATQVLESLAKTGLPSRAEISDAGSAQRAECVMLNKGPYVAEAIETLDTIHARMGKVQRKALPLLRHVESWD
jgi:pyruvate kinase